MDKNVSRLVIHGQPTTLSRFRSTPRQIQRIYGYVKKTIDFHWIQSKHYLNEMLRKHWDLYKILPMITKLLMALVPPLCSQGQHLWKHPCCPNIWVIYHTTLKFPSSTHTHTIILHISTYYTCQHKIMPHPPQEASNRSLAYCALLGVLW